LQKKKNLVWCDDPQEDPVISVFAGCLPNHDHAHILQIVIFDLQVLQLGTAPGSKFSSFVEEEPQNFLDGPQETNT
jgi:hypothetical protein